MRALAGVLLVLAVLAGVWLLGGEAPFRELDQDDLMRLAYLAVLASFVGAGLFTGGFRNVREDIKAVLFWLVALVLVAGLYGLRHDLKAFGLRVAGALVPGLVTQTAGEIVISRGRGGMFLVNGEVNGADVRFLFDTGASGISLSASDARRAGIVPKAEDYRVTTMTANGEAQVAPVTLDRLQVGPITLRRVRATVSQDGALDRSLLGHGFLNELKSYEVRGDQLILRPN